ncbi:MAG: YdeI/OmpD-associated family protein [Deltaproteobacteria bacterium]|nr:YdeI/OmpD-associated family protein [Deltaproteobacteria bacterium]
MISKTLYVTGPREWRAWLRKNRRKEKEIWLVYYKKGSGKPRIDYDDAVEQALCFGWIDSTVRRLDDERYAQRFSPRRAGTGYSQANRERLRALVRRREVAKDVLETLAGVLDEDFVVPRDILKAIKASRKAWENFRGFSEAYKRIRIGFIEDARGRPDEFEKRLRHFIERTEKNRQFGFGGIERHY